MSTRCTFLTTPTVEIDQDRYEELVKREQKYLQYKAIVPEGIRELIEAENVKETEEEKEYETSSEL